MSDRILSSIGMVYLVLCLILGGASAAGAVANAILQGLAIMIILLLIWSGRLVMPREARPLLLMLFIFVAGSLLTLVPLPYSFWQRLPYRNTVGDSLSLLGFDPKSLPISLAPAATATSMLWLLPPVAMFLVVVGLPRLERRRLGWVVVSGAVLSVAFGVLQLLGGTASPFRLYEYTNTGAPVGFFANINHQATLILCAIPFAAGLATQLAGETRRSKRSGGLILVGACSLFLLAGIALCGSFAGYGLFIPVALASFMIYRRGTAGKVGKGWLATLGLIISLVITVALFGLMSQQSLSGKLSTSPDSRREIAATTMEAIKDTFPVGSGLGTFAAIYRHYEDPQQATREYTNRAHNDYLEFVLETGALGLLMLVIFIAWWFRLSVRAWRSDLPGGQLARAGGIVIGVVLLHSIVDYPIRTSSIAAIFALACAFLLPHSQRREQTRRSPSEARETLKHLEAEA